jgi:hypothetical protein
LLFFLFLFLEQLGFFLEFFNLIKPLSMLAWVKLIDSAQYDLDKNAHIFVKKSFEIA